MNNTKKYLVLAAAIGLLATASPAQAATLDGLPSTSYAGEATPTPGIYTITSTVDCPTVPLTLMTDVDAASKEAATRSAALVKARDTRNRIARAFIDYGYWNAAGTIIISSTPKYLPRTTEWYAYADKWNNGPEVAAAYAAYDEANRLSTEASAKFRALETQAAGIYGSSYQCVIDLKPTDCKWLAPYYHQDPYKKYGVWWEYQTKDFYCGIPTPVIPTPSAVSYSSSQRVSGYFRGATYVYSYTRAVHR